MMIFQFNIILLVETFNISTSIQNFFVTNNFEILHLSDVILKDFFHLFFSATSKEEILGSIKKPLHCDTTTEICPINSLQCRYFFPIGGDAFDVHLGPPVVIQKRTKTKHESSRLDNGWTPLVYIKRITSYR